MKYNKAKLEIIYFEAEDVIATSGGSIPEPMPEPPEPPRPPKKPSRQ